MCRFVFLPFLVIAFSSDLLAQEVNLKQQFVEPLWTLENRGFIEPESVAFDPKGNKLYVTNVNGYTKNGLGFISRINGDGTNLELKWIQDLNGPTGIVYHERKLYFADIDMLKVVDTSTGKVIAEYLAPDKTPSLNDVAIDEHGTIYVSASNIQTIYKLHEEQLVPFIRNEKALKYANGIHVQNEHLITGGETLHLWSSTDGRHLQALTQKDSMITNIDGVSVDNKGNIVISLLDDPRLWLITPSNNYMPLDDAQINGIDFYLNADDLYAPRINVEEKDYKVSAYRYRVIN
jgi:DNA-binding beta-propeller fold protein YncE